LSEINELTSAAGVLKLVLYDLNIIHFKT
jgi:hypothetical protein